VYAWLRRHQLLVDGTLALVLVLAGLHEAFHYGPLFQIPFLMIMVVPVTFRRKQPAAAFWIGVAGGGLQALTHGGPSAAEVAIIVLLYTLAAYQPRSQSVPGLLVCIVGSAVALELWVGDLRTGAWHMLASGLVLFGGAALLAWVLGDSMRYRRAYYLALEDRAARLERERDAQAQIGAAAERARIARELHDVVAHNVSVMVVQADGAGYALAGDTERARQALAAISATGRQALAEMRRLLGVLRSDDQRTDLAPQPGLDQLRDLLEQTRAAGRAVTFTLEGEPRALSEGVGLAAYRVVQESLTNVRKHGGVGASVCVLLRFTRGELHVQVTDDGAGAAAEGDGAGLGLTGMRERVTVYGGTLAAGPRAAGGYRVSATLPLDPDVARAPVPAA
jgi:signal transduction histidine kinase